MLIEIYINRLILRMVSILVAVAILSAAPVVVHITQGATAKSIKFNFEQKQKNRCGGNAKCILIATIPLRLGSGDDHPDN